LKEGIVRKRPGGFQNNQKKACFFEKPQGARGPTGELEKLNQKVGTLLLSKTAKAGKDRAIEVPSRADGSREENT